MNTGWVGNNQGDLIKWNRIVNTGRQQGRQGRAGSIAAITQHCYGVEGGTLRVPQPLLHAFISKASLMLLYLPIEQIASRLHDVHQDSHWTPAEFVSQWIVWIFRGRKPAAVGNIRLNLQIRNKWGRTNHIKKNYCFSVRVNDINYYVLSLFMLWSY